jgi:hypothetical protein
MTPDPHLRRLNVTRGTIHLRILLTAGSPRGIAYRARHLALAGSFHVNESWQLPPRRAASAAYSGMLINQQASKMVHSTLFKNCQLLLCTYTYLTAIHVSPVSPSIRPFALFVCNLISTSAFRLAARAITTPLHLSLSLSLGHSCYPPLIRVQSATGDNQLQRRVLSDPASTYSTTLSFVQTTPAFSLQLSLHLLLSVFSSRAPDPTLLEHDVCGLNYSAGSTARPSGSRFGGSACLDQSLPRRHRLRRRRDLAPGEGDLTKWTAGS